MHNMFDAASKTIREWPPRSRDKDRPKATTGSRRSPVACCPVAALIFATGLFMDAWWHIHYVIGFMLIPVVVLKLASTGYRAMRYYTSELRPIGGGPARPGTPATRAASGGIGDDRVGHGRGALRRAKSSSTLSSLHTDARWRPRYWWRSICSRPSRMRWRPSAASCAPCRCPARHPFVSLPLRWFLPPVSS